MRRSLALVLGLVIPLAACLEPPVSESLVVKMRDRGASTLSVAISIRDPLDFQRTPKIQQRLEAEARALEEGRDAWGERIRGANPETQRDVIDRSKGRLTRVTRTAELGTSDDLRRFLRDAGIGAAYRDGEDFAELILTAGPAQRATSSQRAKVLGALEEWSAGLASYVRAVGELYRYLDTHPERARACLGAALTSTPEGEQLTDEEEALATAVENVIGAVGFVLEPAPGEDRTLDELSRLVWDPFPAPTTVEVAGTILEREGFPGELNDPLVVPTLSLWAAFARLEGRWIRPDPMMAMWRADAAGTEFDLDEFVARQRRAAAAPTARDVERAIEEELRAPDVYRVRWKPLPRADPGEERAAR